MPMFGDPIAVDALSYFCVQQVLLGTPPCSTDSRLGINDDVLCLDQLGLHCQETADITLYHYDYVVIIILLLSVLLLSFTS